MDIEALKTQLKLFQPAKSQDVDYLTSYESILDFVLKKTLNDVSLYCHIPIDDLPNSISGTIVMMASNLIGSFELANDQTSGAAGSLGSVKSLTEGDTKVDYATPLTTAQKLQQALAIDSIGTDFRYILNRIRRLPDQQTAVAAGTSDKLDKIAEAVENVDKKLNELTDNAVSTDELMEALLNET
jgi:carbamoylphosphate synthase small subunit